MPCYKASSLTRAPSSPQVLTAASGVQLHAVCIGSISVIERQHGAAPMSERRPSEGPSDEESYSCNGELERPPRCFRHGARRASHTFRCTAFRRPHTYLPYLYRTTSTRANEYSSRKWVAARRPFVSSGPGPSMVRPHGWCVAQRGAAWRVVRGAARCAVQCAAMSVVGAGSL